MGWDGREYFEGVMGWVGMGIGEEGSNKTDACGVLLVIING